MCPNKHLIICMFFFVNNIIWLYKAAMIGSYPAVLIPWKEPSGSAEVFETSLSIIISSQNTNYTN